MSLDRTVRATQLRFAAAVLLAPARTTQLKPGRLGGPSTEGSSAAMAKADTLKDKLLRRVANNKVFVVVFVVFLLVTSLASVAGAVTKIWHAIAVALAPHDTLEFVETTTGFRRLEFSLVNTTLDPLEISSISVVYLGMLDGCPSCLMAGRIVMRVKLSAIEGKLQCAGDIPFEGSERILGSDATIHLKPKEAAPMAIEFSNEDTEGAVLIVELTLISMSSGNKTTLIPRKLIMVPSRISEDPNVRIVPMTTWRSVPDAETRRDLASALAGIRPYCCAEVAEEAERYQRAHRGRN